MAHLQLSLFEVEVIAVGKYSYCFWHLCQPQDINWGVTSISFRNFFFIDPSPGHSHFWHLLSFFVDMEAKDLFNFQQCLLLLTVNDRSLPWTPRRLPHRPLAVAVSGTGGKKAKDSMAEGHVNIKMTLAKQNWRRHQKEWVWPLLPWFILNLSEYPVHENQRALSHQIALVLGFCALKSTTKPKGLLSNILLPFLPSGLFWQILRQSSNS